MLPKELISLIEKYCMGIDPIKTGHPEQMEEIFILAEKLGVDNVELATFINHMMAGPTIEQKLAAEAEAKRKADEAVRKKEKEEAERIAKIKEEQLKKKATQDAYNKTHRKAADGSMHEIEHINATTIWDKQTGLEYYEYQGMPLALCGDRKTSSILVVLETVQEIPIRMFANDGHIEQLVLPQSIKKIGKEAFKNCVNLKKVDLNWGLESMEDECFADCCRLSDVKFSQTVLTYGKNLFSGCPLLKKESFVVSSKVQSIGSHALDAFGMIFVKDQTMAKLVRKSQSLFCSSEIVANSVLYM